MDMYDSRFLAVGPWQSGGVAHHALGTFVGKACRSHCTAPAAASGDRSLWGPSDELVDPLSKPITFFGMGSITGVVCFLWLMPWMALLMGDC